MRTEWILVLLLLIGTAMGRIAAADEQAPDGRVVLDGAALRYEGEITKTMNQRAFELYESSDPRPTTLRIRSVGGEINAGMDLGDFVFDHELAVEVSELCFSSCANYVITAARSVRLAPTAILGWHGGATQQIDPETIPVIVKGKELAGTDPQAQIARSAIRELMRDQIERETAFFAKIGVDQRITILGHSDFYRDRQKDGQRYGGWHYSLEDLRRLGVRSVSVIGGSKWEPGELPGGVKLYRVELESTPAAPSATP